MGALRGMLLLATLLAVARRAAGVATRSRTGVSPVQKVIVLIEEMATKVKEDLHTQEKDFQEYASYCDGEAAAKEYSIKDSKALIEELSAGVEEATAQIEALEAETGELGGQISDVEQEMKASAAVREKEHVDFIEREKTMVEAVTQVDGAIKVLKKASFAQLSRNDRSRLQEIVQALGVIVEASWVTKAQKDTVTAFLQSKEDDEDGAQMLEANPDAILDTLNDMKDKSEATLATTRKEEAEAAHAQEMLSMSLANEVANMKKAMAEATSKKQTNAEDLAQHGKELTEEKTALTEAEAFLRQLKHECQVKAGEFEAEVRDSNAELDALGKAKAILTKQFNAAAAASFLQMSSKVALRSGTAFSSRARAHTKAGARMARFYGQVMDESKALALQEIDRLGRKLHSMALVSLAFRAAQDPFGKIRSMIEEMISKLLQEAAEEADQKSFCDKEIGDSKVSQENKAQRLEELQGRLGKLEASSAQLSEEVAKLHQEIGQIDSAAQEATAIRQKEKESFQVRQKDYSESEQACAAAIQVLQEYYDGGASFLQVAARTSLRSRAKAKAKAGAKFRLKGGDGILGLLEVAESDFASMLAEARAAESAAEEEFVKISQEAKVLRVTKLTEIKGKESEVMSARSAIDQYSQDKDGLSGELDAVVGYLEKLKPQCDTKAPSYEEKKAAREEELDGLKNALSILEGDAGM